MTNGVRNKLTPFCLKFFVARTITKCEYQAIKLADHTHMPAGRRFAACSARKIPPLLCPHFNARQMSSGTAWSWASYRCAEADSRIKVAGFGIFQTKSCCQKYIEP
jgi:hypothetical protein